MNFLKDLLPKVGAARIRDKRQVSDKVAEVKISFLSFNPPCICIWGEEGWALFGVRTGGRRDVRQWWRIRKVDVRCPCSGSVWHFKYYDLRFFFEKGAGCRIAIYFLKSISRMGCIRMERSRLSSIPKMASAPPVGV